MTNFEKYKDKFEEGLNKKAFCSISLGLRSGKGIEEVDEICHNSDCNACQMESLEWLAQEYIESKKEFTQDELTIFRNLDGEWKWIARDEDNSLGVYDKKPFKSSDYWINTGKIQGISLFNCFKQIQWEDSEPVFIGDYVKR